MSSKPTILFMNRVYPPVRGATGRILRDLAQAFVGAGWDVTVISSGENAGEEIEGGVRIIRVKSSDRPRSSMAYMLIWVKMLIAALRLAPHNVLVTLSDPPIIIVAGRIIARVKKCSHINWCQDLYPDILPALDIKMPIFLMKWFRAHRIKAMKSCDKIIVVGRCMTKRLVLEGINAQKIAMIANWPNLELIDPQSSDNSGIAYRKHDEKTARPFEKQFKNNKCFQVLYAGNIGMAHPIDIVLDAAKLLEEQGSDIEFVFIGEGVRFDYIAQRRAQMCLDNLRLLPYQPAPHLRDVMEAGDIHLITLDKAVSGFMVPCKMYSALAVARPSIFVGPKSSEVAKVINDYGAGLVVDNNDAENLVAAILHFREDQDAWYKAHNGAIHAREAFTPNASIEAFIKHVSGVDRYS